MIASASASAKPRMAIVCRRPWASGWRATPVMYGGEDQADADAGADRGQAVADHVDGAVDSHSSTAVSFRLVIR